MKPGATIKPVASSASAPEAAPTFPGCATSTIFSPSMRMSRSASVLLTGSITRPFLIRSIGGFLGFCFQRGVCAAFRRARNQQIKDGHANRHSIRHLLQHARLRAVGDVRRYFDPTVDWPGMQHDRVAVGKPQPLRIELVKQNIVVRGKGWIIEPLCLDAQHDNDVRALQRFLHVVDAANRRARRDFFQFAGHPHGGATKREPATELSEQVDIRTRHAAVQHVAENRHVQIFDGAQAVANRQRVQQSLGGMLVRAVTCIDNRNVQVPRNVIGSSRSRVPHHQAIRLHCVQIECRVEERLALLDARSFGLQIHRVRAQAGRRRSKADARTRGILEKRERHGLAAQRCQLFQGMLLDFLERFALVEKKSEFVRRERFESEQIAEAVSQCPHSNHKSVRILKRKPLNYSTRSTSTTRSSLSISRRRTSIISVSLVWTLRPIYCASMGISRWPRSISTQRRTRFGRPRSKRPFIAARIVRPVYKTSSTNTRSMLSTPKGISEERSTACGATLDRSSRYRVMSNTPTGTSTPSIPRIACAIRCASGTPRRTIPIRARCLVPPLFSTISCASRCKVRSISGADINCDFSTMRMAG